VVLSDFQEIETDEIGEIGGMECGEWSETDVRSSTTIRKEKKYSGQRDPSGMNKWAKERRKEKKPWSRFSTLSTEQ